MTDVYSQEDYKVYQSGPLALVRNTYYLALNIQFNVVLKMRLRHSPDVSTFPRIKLTCFVYYFCFLEIIKFSIFNRDTCSHLAYYASPLRNENLLRLKRKLFKLTCKLTFRYCTAQCILCRPISSFIKWHHDRKMDNVIKKTEMSSRLNSSNIYFRYCMNLADW